MSGAERWARNGPPVGGPGWAVLFNALNNMKAQKLDAGKFADGQGLWLIKRNKQHGKWILRISLAGRRREMGLGRWPDVSIAEARERAAKARRQVRDNLDPIEERTKARYKPKRLTITEAIERCHAAKLAELKGETNANRWLSPLAVHIIPAIGKEAIEDLDQHRIIRALKPIWHEKPEAARKAMNRLAITLRHAAALGLDVDLQATMKAKALLGKSRHEVTHIPSLPYGDAPAFYKMLCTKKLTSCLALRFLILTVARTSEVRFATFDEIDVDVWTLPAVRTKSNREHRVPLTDEALKVIELARKKSENGLLFPSPSGKGLSDAAMAKFMKDSGHDARPHGFRATFRTWVEEQTDADYETKEAALGHAVDSGTVRAYQRSDRFEKRRAVMKRWETFLTGPNAA